MHALPLLILCTAGAGPQYDGQLLDFTATWCGPCQRMNPIVHRLQGEGYPVRKVDIDRERSLAQQYGVTNIPAFVLVVNGKVVDRVVGVTSESRLRGMVARIPEKSPPVAAAPRRSTPRNTTPRNAAPSNTQPVSNTLGDPADFPGTVRANNDDTEDEFAAPNSADRPTPRTSAASVRVRVVDPKGVNNGSATIVESKPGRTLLLGCGHVFEDLAKDSRIEVDVFEWEGGEITGRETFVGEVIAYDLDADVSLLSIATDRRQPVCPISRTKAKVNDALLNIGCSRGELPTREAVRVKQVNRYLGAENLECTGYPVLGRSGGGLFNRKGEVVGVCIARDPRHRDGIYAGLEAIHEFLDQHDHAHLYTGEKPGESYVATEASTRGGEPVLPDDAAKLLDDADDAEVICIIRKRGEPESRSRVVIINRASSKFVGYLTGEMRDQPKLTSDHVDRPTARESMERRLEGSGWQILRKPAVLDRRPAPAAAAAAITPECENRPPQRYRRSAASRNLD